MKQKLLVRGEVSLGATAVTSGEVWRSMRVLAEDGAPAGVVAAVVCSDLTHEVTHILLGQAPPTDVYRLIPLDLIDRLDGACLWLRAPLSQIAGLPIHQPDC